MKLELGTRALATDLRKGDNISLQESKVILDEMSYLPASCPWLYSYSSVQITGQILTSWDYPCKNSDYLSDGFFESPCLGSGSLTAMRYQTNKHLNIDFLLLHFL